MSVEVPKKLFGWFFSIDKSCSKCVIIAMSRNLSASKSWVTCFLSCCCILRQSTSQLSFWFFWVGEAAGWNFDLGVVLVIFYHIFSSRSFFELRYYLTQCKLNWNHGFQWKPIITKNTQSKHNNSYFNIYIYIHFIRLMFIKQELFQFQTFTTTNQTEKKKQKHIYIYMIPWNLSNLKPSGIPSLCIPNWSKHFWLIRFEKMESPSISKSIWNCDSFCCFCIIFSPCNRLAVGLSEPSELGSEHTSSPTASLQNHPFQCQVQVDGHTKSKHGGQKAVSSARKNVENRFFTVKKWLFSIPLGWERCAKSRRSKTKKVNGVILCTSRAIHGTGIFTYIYHKNHQPNAGKCAIHGCYGIWSGEHHRLQQLEFKSAPGG